MRPIDRLRVLCCWASWLCCLLGSRPLLAADDLPAGLQRLSDGQHLTVITDLPLDDGLRELPELFDAAVAQWSETFAVSAQKVSDWRATLYLMLDRERFRQAGLIPDELPQFKYGWQAGNQLWVVEQPSPYYRRHLVLHEGTHWFMTRLQGSPHAPWLMEGVAEWLATHRWQPPQLELGVIPRSREEAPFWGRTRLIREQLAAGSAPSLEQIWRYGPTAHQQLDAYAWSWAAVWFLKEHPQTAHAFRSLLQQRPMDARQTELWLRSRWSDLMPRLRADWAAFVADLDYGFTPVPGLLQLSASTQPLAAPPVTVDVRVDRGWQASGLTVAAGQTLQLTAEGDYIIATEPKPWRCQPEGVTLDYYRGHPLGKLLLTIMAPLDQEPATTARPTIHPIGSQAKLVAASAGELFFRINEPNAALGDNSGQLRVQVSALLER